MAHQEEVARARKQYEQTILARSNVVGAGTGYKITRGETTDELCLVVLVRQKLPVAALTREDLVPDELDGIVTDVVQVGNVRAQQSHKDRWRPVPGGVSLGHHKITAGTFGVVVRDRASGDRLMLSNNHVLANSNDAVVGDAILQPGAADGGNEADDTIAHLERFCPLNFSVAPPTCSTATGLVGFANAVGNLLGTKHRFQAFESNPQAVNSVDAAVARPLEGVKIRDGILEIGVVSGIVPATLGMEVRKSGRTTGFTTGTISVLDATVDINYGEEGMARFEGQIVSGPMSEGGDSGSLLVAGDALNAVGLLFAGSSRSTIFNPIQEVLDCLEIEI